MEKKEEKKKPSGSFSEVWDKRGQETDAANDFRKKIEMEITEARPGYAVGGCCCQNTRQAGYGSGTAS